MLNNSECYFVVNQKQEFVIFLRLCLLYFSDPSKSILLTSSICFPDSVKCMSPILPTVDSYILDDCFI